MHTPNPHSWSRILIACFAALLCAGHGRTALAQHREARFKIVVEEPAGFTVNAVRVQFQSDGAPAPAAMALTRKGKTFTATLPVKPAFRSILTPTLVIETSDPTISTFTYPARAIDFRDPKDPLRMNYRLDRHYDFPRLDLMATRRVFTLGSTRREAAPCQARIRAYNSARNRWINLARMNERAFTSLGRAAIAAFRIPLDRGGRDFSERMDLTAIYRRGQNPPGLVIRREWRLLPRTATRRLDLVFGDALEAVRISMRAHLPGLGMTAAQAEGIADIAVNRAGAYSWQRDVGSDPVITVPGTFALANDQEGDNVMHEFGHQVQYTMGWQPNNTQYLVMERANTHHTPGRVCDGEHIAWEEALCHVIGTWGLTRYLRARTPGLQLPHGSAGLWREDTNDGKHGSAVDMYNWRVLRDMRRGRNNTGGWIEDVVTAALFDYYAERGITGPEPLLRALFADLRDYCTAQPDSLTWCAREFFHRRRTRTNSPVPGVDERRVIDQLMLWYTLDERPNIHGLAPIETLVPLVATRHGRAPVRPGEEIEISAYARALPRIFQTTKFTPIVARLHDGTNQLGNDTRFKEDRSRTGYNAVAKFKVNLTRPGEHKLRVEIFGDFVARRLERIGRSPDLSVKVARTSAAIEFEPAVFPPNTRVKAKVKLLGGASNANGIWRWEAGGPVKLEDDWGDSIHFKARGPGTLTARLMVPGGRGKPEIERARIPCPVKPLAKKRERISLKAVGRNYFLKDSVGHGAYNLKNFNSRVFMNPGDASGQVLWKRFKTTAFTEAWYTYIPIQLEITGNIKVMATGVWDVGMLGDPCGVVYLDPAYPNWITRIQVVDAPKKVGPGTWDRKTNMGGAILARFRFVERKGGFGNQKDLVYAMGTHSSIHYRYEIENWRIKKSGRALDSKDWTECKFWFQVLQGPPPGAAARVTPATVPAAPPVKPKPGPARDFKLVLVNPGRKTVRVGERLPLRAVFTMNGKPVTAANFVFHWQPHPEADFEEYESTKPVTAVRFKEAGPVKVWVSALERNGEVLSTVSEAQFIEIEVLGIKPGGAAATGAALPAPNPPRSRPLSPAAGTGAAGMKTTFSGRLGKIWKPVSAAGGDFRRHACTGGSGLIVRVPKKSNWGKTGICSVEAVIVVDPARPATHRFDLAFNPKGTRSFGIALTDSPAADAWHTTNAWIAWTLPPFARRSRIDFLNSRSPDDRTTAFLPPRCPARVSVLVRGEEVEIRTSFGTRHRRRFPWLGKPGVRAWLQVFSQAPTPNVETSLHLKSVRAGRSAQPLSAIAPPRAETPPPAGEALTVFNGRLGSAWEPIQAAGGNFRLHAHAGGSGFVVKVPGKQNWGKVGVRSASPLFWTHPSMDREPLRIDVDFDPARTSGFCVALSPVATADVCHVQNVWAAWVRTPHAMDAILDVQNTSSSRDSNASRLASPRAPGRLSLIVRHDRVTVTTPDGKIADGRYAWLTKPDGPVYLYVFSQPCQAHQPVVMHVKRISLRSGMAAAALSTPDAPPDRIPPVAIYTGPVKAPWVPLSAAGGDFRRFACAGNSGLVVRCSGKASWSKTGIKSTRPLFWGEHWLDTRPVELSCTFDPARTTTFCIALCSTIPGDPWQTENVHVNWSRDPDGKGAMLHVIQGRNPRELDTKLLLDAQCPRVVKMRVTADRIEVFLDGKPVAAGKVSWLKRKGVAVYPCIFTAPREQNGPCRMLLQRVTAGRGRK